MKLNFTHSYISVGTAALFLCGTVHGNIFPIATTPSVEFGGGASFDGTNYLVAMTSGTNVAGQALSAAGQLLGPALNAGANAGFPPAVALAAGTTNSLVAWSDLSISSGVTMFGRLVSPGSGLASSAFPLLASEGSHSVQFVQAAASDGTNFLVVWQDAADATFYGQFVTAAGTLAGSEFVLFAYSGDVGERNVTAAFGQTNYIVTWQAGGNSTNNTYCVMVSTAGAVAGPFQLNAQASVDHNPLAAGFNGTNYLVVWSSSSQQEGVRQLRGRFVSPGGTPLGDEIQVASDGATFPALAFDGDSFLLAWGHNSFSTNGDASIHARFLDPLGSPRGPAFVPFSTQGTNPPLLPLNGILFSGTKFLLTATFGSFQVNEVGDVVGFAGGDIYGTFLPRSTTPPVFTNAAVTAGHFQGGLHVVPGITYTIEISSNAASWLPVASVSSDSTNVLDLYDESDLVPGALFYRAVRGNHVPPSFGLQFIEFAYGGGFESGFTPATSFPVTLNSYTALFDVSDDAPMPEPETILFTGPAGSGLENAPADPSNSNVDETEANYQSPFVSTPAAAPGGTWTVNYKGTNINFTVPDPQAVARLVVPVPTVVVTGGFVQNVSWVYRDAATGSVLGGAPAHVTGIQVQIDGTTGGRIYNSPDLSSDVTSHAVSSSVTWSNVETIHMAYDDTLGNHYVVSFSKP